MKVADWGFVALYSGRSARSDASNLNRRPRRIVPNACTVAPGRDGRIGMYTFSSTAVIIDLAGYVAPAPWLTMRASCCSEGARWR